MKKHLFILFVLSIVWNTASAQFSISPNEFPVGGTVYSRFYAWDWIDSVGNSGPNQTYTFANLYTVFSDSVVQINAGMTPFIGDHLGATVAIVQRGDAIAIWYYTADSNAYWLSGVTYMGDFGQGWDTIHANHLSINTDTLLSTNYSYGNTEMEYSTITINLSPTFVYKILSTRYVNCDGWGTLTTTLNNYDTILRVKNVQIRMDTIFSSGVPVFTSNDTTYYYDYYSKNVRHPVLTAYTNAVDVIQYIAYLYFPPDILGCTDSMATNYNPIANKEDSNCVYCNTINYSISSDTGICYGDSITLIVSGGSQYIWSTGSNSSLITVKPDSSETYSVYISDTTQCWDLATVVVTVYQSVKASFWTDQPSYSAGDSILFINSSAEATDFYWEFDDSINNTSVAEDPTHSYVSNGIKKVALIASNPCFSDTFYRTLNIFPASSIEDNLPPIFTSLRLYPNPGCSSLNIDLELSLDAHLEFCVIDIVGRKILIHESENAKGTHHYLLQDEISFIPQGIYIVQINILDKNSGEFIGSTNIKWVKTN